MEGEEGRKAGEMQRGVRRKDQVRVLTIRTHLSWMLSVLSGSALVLLHLQASSPVDKDVLKEMRQSPLHRASGKKVEGVSNGIWGPFLLCPYL